MSNTPNTVLRTTIPTAAAPRDRSPLAAPSTLILGVDSWRSRVPGLRVPAAMRAESVFGTTNYTTTNHNSIRSTGVASVKTGGNAHGAAKQAAPPRGEPR